MRYQPNRNYVSNDDIQTPVELAERIVKYFKPKGRILEPCAGEGHFLQHLPGADWCEIKQGRDFLSYEGKVDWIITNPPWSQIRPFLAHSLKVADQIVFLMTVNHAWTKARLRIARESGFSLRTLLLVDTPPSFPQSGFQLGAVHYSKGWTGPVDVNEMVSPSALCK
jgi:hypothetical protein